MFVQSDTAMLLLQLAVDDWIHPDLQLCGQGGALCFPANICQLLLLLLQTGRSHAKQNLPQLQG
jgi:hypothetical protein